MDLGILSEKTEGRSEVGQIRAGSTRPRRGWVRVEGREGNQEVGRIRGEAVVSQLPPEKKVFLPSDPQFSHL